MGLSNCFSINEQLVSNIYWKLALQWMLFITEFSSCYFPGLKTYDLFLFFSFSGHWTKTVNNHYVIISLRNFWHMAAVAVATLCVISHNSFPRGLKVLGGLLSRPAQIRMLPHPLYPHPPQAKLPSWKHSGLLTLSQHMHTQMQTLCVNKLLAKSQDQAYVLIL